MLLPIIIGSSVLLLAINMLSSSYHPQDRFYFDEFGHPILRGHMDYQEYAMVHRVKRQTSAAVNAVLFALFVFIGMALYSDYQKETAPMFKEKLELEKTNTYLQLPLK